MYSGTTLTTFSGRVLGAHQKIDRVARRHMDVVLPDISFPTIGAILHFEGGNGPDAIKRKSPAHDEPWHFFDPFDDEDTKLLQLIEDHYAQLVAALKAKNTERSAFEAAWLAHAAVDGLTPAHHYPYEEELTELRGGEGNETRSSIRDKLVLPGETKRDQVKNNWKMWGPKGLFTNHYAFEWGIATMIVPMRFTNAMPTLAEVRTMQKTDLATWYRRTAQEVAALELYHRFIAEGWTPKNARVAKRQLAPALVRSITTMWCAAVLTATQEAKTVRKKA